VSDAPATEPLIRRSSGDRWSIWCDLDARPEELAREFEPTAQSISTWVKQAERDAGKRVDGPTSAEREELGRLRRENYRLRQERDILAKAAAWFARESEARTDAGHVAAPQGPAAGGDRGLIRFAKPMVVASCTSREDFTRPCGARGSLTVLLQPASRDPPIGFQLH
jgi:transposase